MKKFVEYLKASSAVSYRLADPQNLQRVSLTDSDRKAGAVDKIRLKTTIEELLLEVERICCLSIKAYKYKSTIAGNTALF